MIEDHDSLVQIEMLNNTVKPVKKVVKEPKKEQPLNLLIKESLLTSQKLGSSSKKKLDKSGSTFGTRGLVDRNNNISNTSLRRHNISKVGQHDPNTTKTLKFQKKYYDSGILRFIRS